MDAISRKTAMLSNLSKFFTNAPCKRGHISRRWTSTGGCVECTRPKAKPKTPSARDAARQSGQMYYLPEKPCPRGHMTQRYVSTGGCIECLNNPINGVTRVTLAGSMLTIEQVLEYHAYLVSQEPTPLTVEHMVGGPRLAALNLQRVRKRRREV